jgi:hypothetical protein
MTDKRLLQIIDQHANDLGNADGKTVKDRYGVGFDDAFMEAIRAGHIDQRSPVGSIKLSPSGRHAAR